MIGKGLRTGQFYDPILSEEQLTSLEIMSGELKFNGDAEKFRLGIEALRLGLAYEYDPYFTLSIAKVDPLPHQLEAVYDYFLKLEEEGSENCGEILAVENNETIRGVYNAPNPFSQHTTIYLHTGEPTTMNLDILDMTGRKIMTSQVSLNQGLNLIPINMGKVPPGVYSYMLYNHRAKVVHKMVVYQ